jgi:hypothetical protein
LRASPKSLAKGLRKHLEDPGSFEIPADGAAARWLSALALGSRVGKTLRVSRDAAIKARAVLLSELEAQDFSVLDASPATRAESLASSNNEKLHGASPRARRVAIKAFPGRPLIDAGRELWLAPRDNLEVDLAAVVRFGGGHRLAVLVENWEAFERLPALDSPICGALPEAANPLAIWRGSKEHHVGTSIRALEALNVPCFAYVDFDPSALVFAQALPGFVDVLSPPIESLDAMFAGSGRTRLFAQQQPPQWAGVNPPPKNWLMVWEMCRRHGKGLPQEHFSA